MTYLEDQIICLNGHKRFPLFGSVILNDLLAHFSLRALTDQKNPHEVEFE